ncbi:hypothetical protein G5T42_16430 [Microbacterium sp. 4R-513]|uniref:hypothetical protein n=1 Tax=Microbacterium sp. 4R-513 TaxID=2567934 RepID=UPI0013E1F469|nr:hypothetical protein [Microbacterium sp. 4R-513]QIG40864.1 hypothetical protein G5T42_16430 [Microbacterium sp. 4R-513]
MSSRDKVLAWVESPLQLVGAAEWAAAQDRAVPVAGRLTAQMSETADELIARGALFGVTEPYLGIPWKLLSQHDHWLVGDGFSGQFRLALTVLRPKALTFLDDGANTLPFARALVGTGPYARPGVEEGRMTSTLAPFALERTLRLAAARHVSLFTAFEVAERDALARRGIAVVHHRFDWVRASAPAGADVGPRVLMGSARPVDGRMRLGDYLRWVAGIAASGPVTYLPHRREPQSQLDAVREIRGVAVSAVRLPAELVLAGAPGPLDIFTLPSSTATTLPLVLDGARFAIRTKPARTEGVTS